MVNKRVVPITVIEKGIYAKEKDEIFKENINSKIGFSDLLKFKVLTSDLNQELLEKLYNEGDNLKIYGFFKCASVKIYNKRINYIVTEFEME